MSIKLVFEIGHQASRKTKPSKEGFTHDWELFVRGEAGSEISHFVDKVVFVLHESFPKPKRVLKDPPYSVKESGYAAFIVKVEIHFKNREEPKKVIFEYDLDLQPAKLLPYEFIVQTNSDEFRKKCLKGGGQPIGDFKSRDPHHKPSSSSNDVRKISKRPEDIVKPNDKFHDIFGQPLSRAHQNPSPIPSKSTSNKPTTSSSTKDKLTEKPKHKHSPTKDGSKDQTKKSSQDSEKIKKDKVKDRERSEKKEKTAKRPSSPSPSSSMSSSSARNSTIPVPSLKPDSKTKSKSNTSSTNAISTSDPAFIKKSNKKDKKNDKERDRNDKKDQRKFESPPNKTKDRDPPAANVKEEKKMKSSPGESKVHQPADTDKRQQQHDKDAERKHKHKKKDKDKSKDKEAEKDIKKEKTSKSSSYQAKTKELMKSQTPISEIESDVESPPSIKQESENSNSDSVPPKLPAENKKSDKRSKNDSKEEKSRKRKATKDNDMAISPPLTKNSKVDTEKSNDSHTHNNNNVDDGMKLSNEYISELKDLKQKITGLKNNDELQHVVKIIASTGCYEITKSSFDFDLVQLDRSTVQSLLEMFKLKK